MALHFCSCLLGGEAPGAAGSDQHTMGLPGVGVELEDGAQRLMPRLGTRGIAHMHGAAVAPLHGDGDTALDGQGLAQRVPAVVDALGLELQTQRVNEVIGQHADEKMAFDAAINLVEHRAQPQVGLQRAKHRLQLGEHDVGAPQRGVVLVDQGGAQAVHARMRSRAGGLDAFDPGE